MKTKKFTLSRRLEILYTLYQQTSNIQQEQAQEIAEIKLQILTLFKQIQALEAAFKEMPTQKLDE